MHDWLCSLAKFSVDPEALRNWVPHTEGGTLVQNRYLVLTKATARQAPDDDSLKLGEMPEGLVVQCVEELTDAEGIERVRCCGSVVDCRPIDARGAVERAGFGVAHRRVLPMYGLCVEVVEGRRPP